MSRILEKELEAALEAARLGGQILKDKAGNVGQIQKKGEIDLVTDADILSEKALIEVLGRDFPEDEILTEESQGRAGNSGRVWILDPLDGTTNFAHGFPVYAVSIGLWADGRMMLGVVLNPVADEEFTAVRGQGAFLNGRPMRVSRTESLKDALLATGFPYDIQQNPGRILRNFEKLILRSRGVRRPGSAAVDLCYVAAGRFDGFWEERLHPWDTAAGALLVEEAGGAVTSFEGRPYNPWDKSIAAGNPLIHREVLEVLQS